jgi:hypothetical protein
MLSLAAVLYCENKPNRGDAMAGDERTNSLAGTRVLVVDEEYFFSDDLSRSLVQAGAEVVGPIGVSPRLRTGCAATISTRQ